MKKLIQFIQLSRKKYEVLQITCSNTIDNGKKAQHKCAKLKDLSLTNYQNRIENIHN
jgi:hypothetical protein